MVQQALGNPVTTSDNSHLAAFGFHLRQERCLLPHRPLPAPFDPPNDLELCQSRLHLELRKATPAEVNVVDFGDGFHTRLTGRLQKIDKELNAA